MIAPPHHRYTTTPAGVRILLWHDDPYRDPDPDAFVTVRQAVVLAGFIRPHPELHAAMTGALTAYSAERVEPTALLPDGTLLFRARVVEDWTEGPGADLMMGIVEDDDTFHEFLPPHHPAPILH